MNGKLLAMVLAAAVAGGMVARAEGPATTAAATSTAGERTKALGEMLDTGIKLLEEKKYEAVMELLLQPADLAKQRENAENFKKLLADFGAKKAGPLLDALKSAKGATPTWNDDQTKVAFKMEKRPLKFVWVDGVWRLEGH